MYSQKILQKIASSYLPTPELEFLEWIEGSGVQVVTGVIPLCSCLNLECPSESFLLALSAVTQVPVEIAPNLNINESNRMN